MADYGQLARDLVANAINNQLPGLTKDIVIRFFVSEGEYDAEADTTTPVYQNTTPFKVVAAKPTFEDVQEYEVNRKSIKLLVPGKSVSKQPANDVDKVLIGKIVNGVLTGATEWNIQKVVGVPGDPLYLVFVGQT